MTATSGRTTTKRPLPPNPQEVFRRLYYFGWTLKEIVTVYDVSYRKARDYINAAGCMRPRAKRPGETPTVVALYTDEVRQQIVNMYVRQRLSIEKICRHFKTRNLEYELTESRVKAILRLAQVSPGRVRRTD